MHGRVKIRTSEEQSEAKRREQQEKLKIYQEITDKIFSKRRENELDEEGLELTARVLEKNPDTYTFWNYRREILLHFKNEKNECDLKRLCLIELDLTQNCLRVNPKSYSVWHHRFWTGEFMPDADWKQELKLCNYFLSKDERNFHCWDYRRLVKKKCSVPLEEELTFSTKLIETNFSNYSAWHYRSTLLPIIHSDPIEGRLKEEILLKEFDLIQNAAFTDPDDQSVWFYHRWLLGRSKDPLQILNVSVLKPDNVVIALLSEPVKIAQKYLMLNVNETHIPVSWSSLDSCYLVWKCDLPASVLEMEAFKSESGDMKCKISVLFKKETENSSLSCEVTGKKSFAWWKTTRINTFRPDFSAATKDVLERELESCKQLNDLETNCKWTLFTCVLLMRALNNIGFQKDMENFMRRLVEIDSMRKNYYKDLGSKFVIEDTIENLPVDAMEVNLSNRRLTSLCHFNQLILIEKIDLSSNYLTSVCALSYLICANTIILDDNKLTNLEGIQELHNLEILSVKRNFIKEVSSLENLKSCRSLHKLFLEGNPVVNDALYAPTVKMFSTLTLTDGSSL